jgi:hypothetical protein
MYKIVAVIEHTRGLPSKKKKKRSLIIGANQMYAVLKLSFPCRYGLNLHQASCRLPPKSNRHNPGSRRGVEGE